MVRRGVARIDRALRQTGVVSVSSAVDGPLELLVGDYRRYLENERGLAEGTIYHYERVARLFLEDRQRSDGLPLERLTAADVTGFLARECPKRSCVGRGIWWRVCARCCATCTSPA